MKSIIFVLLIYNSFCQIYELQKYGSVETTYSNGIVYLNTEDFSVGDTVYIQFNAVNGEMNPIIYYQFYNSKPNLSFNPSKSMSASNRGNSETNVLGKVTYKEKYYYNIKKEENRKYLIISYSDFQGYSFGKSYLEIEHTKVNWAITMIIIILSVIGLSFIIVIAFICIKRYKKKSKNLINYQATTPSYTPPSSIPPQYNQNNTGYDSTTFNNYPQQQNIYYEPPQAPINY